MSVINRTDQLHALPVAVVEIENGIALKRGCTETKMEGEGISQVVRIILAATTERGATPEELLNLFAPVHRPLIEEVLEGLVKRRLLVFASDFELSSNHVESHEDIFYWHFDAQTQLVRQRLNSVRLAILGVNMLSRPLAISLQAAGFEKVEIFDTHLLRNPQLFDERGGLRPGKWQDSLPIPQVCREEIVSNAFDCIIATSDLGRSPILSEWNKICVDYRRVYLPVVLRDMIGYVGPMVLPGETACFDCLKARQNSHSTGREVREAVEKAVFNGKGVNGFHPSMASILADIATIELVKFYSGVLPRQVGTLIECNLLATRLTARKVLKVPRCYVCSPLKTHSAITPNHRMFTRADEDSA